MAIKQHISRPAVILDVDPINQTCTIQYADRVSNSVPFICPLPHPMASAGWGMLAVPTKGTRVMVDTTVGELPHIVSTIPSNQFSSDFSNQENLNNISVSDTSYPALKSGEMALQSPSGSSVSLLKTGSIKLSTADIAIDYNPLGIISEDADSVYTNTEGGREIIGEIKRDLRRKPKENEKFFDKLVSLDLEPILTTIGKNPLNKVETLTIKNTGNTVKNDIFGIVRNPALVEKHSIIYEFANSFQVGTQDEEKIRVSGSENDSDRGDFLFQPDRRDQQRTDILNLGLHNPNQLIEHIEGTVVDIYGNILDLNRNIIDFSLNPGSLEDKVIFENQLLRRSIKLHLEINSKKNDTAEGSTATLDALGADQASATGYSHSRWSIDVDGEGLTKINIPASSDTGNIPLLARYTNACDKNNRNSASFRPDLANVGSARIDIQHMAFGNTEGFGIDISEHYAPANIADSNQAFKYRTAYHDLIGTAGHIFADTGGFLLNTHIENNINGSATPNAGGRSIHANFDGSMELNVGRDTIDKKSIILDTSGSIVSRIGMDANKNSIISQTDGDILLQIGGDSVRGESKKANNSLKLYINNNDGTEFHKIEINSNGIFITSAPNTNMIFNSSRNLILNAQGQTFIGGENIFAYGSFSTEGNDIAGERLVIRNGLEVK